MRTPKSPEPGITKLSELTIDADLAMGAHNITLGAGQTVDGKDVSALVSKLSELAIDAELAMGAHNITLDEGQTVGGIIKEYDSDEDKKFIPSEVIKNFNEVDSEDFVTASIRQIFQNYQSASYTIAIYGGAKERFAQKMTPSAEAFKSIGVQLRKVGAPTGDFYFKVWKVSDSSVVVEKAYDIATLSVGDPPGVFVEVQLDTLVTVDEEVYVGVEYTGGDAANYLKPITGYGGGANGYYYDGSWTLHDRRLVSSGGIYVGKVYKIMRYHEYNP